MGLLNFFRKPTVTLKEPLTLVAAVGDQFAPLMEQDKDAYLHCSERVDVRTFQSVEELLSAMRSGYQILHVYVEAAPDGTLAGTSYIGTHLIVAAAEGIAKLLVIANPNDPRAYIGGFKASGVRLNIVMTVDRRGSIFPTFLRSLLSEMQTGLSMPRAWAKLAPQIPGQDHPDAPGTIFFAGLGQERFV